MHLFRENKSTHVTIIESTRSLALVRSSRACLIPLACLSSFCPTGRVRSWRSCILQGGMYVFQLFDYYTGSRIILIVALFECFVVSYIYGMEGAPSTGLDSPSRFCRHSRAENDELRSLRDFLNSSIQYSLNRVVSDPNIFLPLALFLFAEIKLQWRLLVAHPNSPSSLQGSTGLLTISRWCSNSECLPYLRSNGWLLLRYTLWWVQR